MTRSNDKETGTFYFFRPRWSMGGGGEEARGGHILEN